MAFIRARRERRGPRVRDRGTLVAPNGCDSMVAVGMTASGPVAIWSSAGGAQALEERDERPGWASFPRSTPSREPAVTLVAYQEAGTIVGHVSNGSFVEESRVHLWAPDGSPLPMASTHCRGSVADFFAGAHWYSFDLLDLADDG
jgi:hypothetical protein